MPYITPSRGAIKDPRVSKACRLVAGLFNDGVVVRRGAKTVSKVAIDATSKGFGKAVILGRLGNRIAADVLVPTGNKGSYKWGARYLLQHTKSGAVRIAEQAGGKRSGAKGRFIAEAQ